MSRAEVRHLLMELPDPDADELWQRADELAPYERERIDALRQPGDRWARLAAHLLVREAAGALLGVAPASLVVRQQCPGCGATGHGRPFLADHPDVAVSLSHAVRQGTDGTSVAVAAVAVPGREPVGIDVEHRGSRVPARAFNATERAVLDTGVSPVQLWTRKEAAVKAGATSLDRLAELSVTAPWSVGDRTLVFADLLVGDGTRAVGSWARWA